MWAKLLALLIGVFSLIGKVGTVVGWISHLFGYFSRIVSNSRLAATVFMCALIMTQYGVLRILLRGLTELVLPSSSGSLSLGFLDAVLDVSVLTDLAVSLLSAYITSLTMSSSIIGVRALISMCKGYGTMVKV